MIFNAETTTVFIPEFKGNRKKPDAEQIKITIKWPNMEEREGLTELHNISEYSQETLADAKKKKGSKKEKKKFEFTVENKVSLILRNHVTKVENIAISSNGKTKPITTGIELAECTAPGLSRIVDEIVQEVLKVELDEEELKNLK